MEAMRTVLNQSLRETVSRAIDKFVNGSSEKVGDRISVWQFCEDAEYCPRSITNITTAVPWLEFFLLQEQKPRVTVEKIKNRVLYI